MRKSNLLIRITLFVAESVDGGECGWVKAEREVEVRLVCKN